MDRVQWPVVLSTLFAILLGWYVLYTQRMVQGFRANAEILTEVLVEVNGVLTDTSNLGDVEAQLRTAEQALIELQDLIKETGIPLVLMGAGDTVLAVENLPFDADPATFEGQERIRRYVRRLDQQNPPVGNLPGPHLHYGDTPEVRGMVWIAGFQAVGLLLTVLIGFAVIRSQRRADAERAWTSMARELAHQLGTPISSLQGWLEVMRLSPDERPGELGEGEVADAIQEDLRRLERVSHRFELIGREPELERLSVQTVVGDLERYLRARLPRFGPGVKLRVDVPPGLPPIRGNEVLLAWALENVVKNALDALAGTGGRIEVRASRANQWVLLRISDSGPGVDPEIRDRIFDPGVTTKSGGWGVGLALSRRIVEGVHKGRIELLDGQTAGATFLIYLPAAS
ncbi:MAG TPA: HAMP domain-containing sensor histidine kinase [Longimicrobiales bacterium]|nr:HAMP domain-containing sensor histidine kinase [Longimicrobiales bacterium]